MQKFKIKPGLVIIATILFLGCNNGFMERYPLDSISNETFWNSENDLIVYNNSLYNLMKDDNKVPILIGHGTYDIGRWFLDEFSDNYGSTEPRHNYYHAVRSGKHNIPSSPEFYGYKGWDFVRACNVGLENYNNADIGQSTIDKYAGEARLFRGLFYADKVSKFGDVPWIEKELNIDSEELYAERTPREEAMEKVLADLNFACEKLPADWGDGNAPGRLNRWAALHEKSRVCLFEGTWRKYHGGTNANMWLQEAADAAKELIEDGPYKLYVTGDIKNDYNASHRSNDLSGNPEIIHWRKYEMGVITNQAMGYFGYTGGATKSMVEDYLCTDGLPITLSPLYQGDEVYEDIFENRDPRLRQTILHPNDQSYYNYDGSSAYSYPRVLGMIGGISTNTGYHVIKNYEYSRISKAYNTEETPALILRLGEALLNYAEAKAELGTIIQADLDMSINKLRDRVGMPHMDLNNIPVDPRYVNNGVSPLIIEIRRERRVELFLEGFRYDDLRRWKQGKKLEIPVLGMRWDDAARARFDPENKALVKTRTISGIEYIDVYLGTDWANPVFDESKHYLWPIPISDLSRNPNIGQNPGWN